MKVTNNIELTERRNPIAGRIWMDSSLFLQVQPQSYFHKYLATNLFFSGHEVNLYPGMARIIFKPITDFFNTQKLPSPKHPTYNTPRGFCRFAFPHTNLCCRA